MSINTDDEVTDPRKDTALRAILLAAGAMMVAGLFGLEPYLERHNSARAGASKIEAMFDGVDQDMLVREDLIEISRFLTRERAQRKVAILRLSEDVALSCELNRDGDFKSEFRDVIDNEVSSWSWPSETTHPAAIDALCGMMLETVLAAQSD